MDDANHKLECSLRFVCSRQLHRRVRAETARVKRRTVSEFLRTIVEMYLAEHEPTACR